MRVTKANTKDLEAIVKLNKLFRLDFSWFKWDSPQCVGVELENKNYYVIRNNGEIVASMCLKMLDEEGYIESIAVQQERQGRGFGRRLIEFAKVHSKQKRKSKLSVESFCEYGIEEFYEKCGFTRYSKLENNKGFPYYCFSMTL